MVAILLFCTVFLFERHAPSVLILRVGDYGSDTWLTGNATASFYYNNALSLTRLSKSVITYNDSFNHTLCASIIYESNTSTLCGGHVFPSLT